MVEGRRQLLAVRVNPKASQALHRGSLLLLPAFVARDRSHGGTGLSSARPGFRISGRPDELYRQKVLKLE